jgi:hypothetical protein
LDSEFRHSASQRACRMEERITGQKQMAREIRIKGLSL